MLYDGSPKIYILFFVICSYKEVVYNDISPIISAIFVKVPKVLKVPIFDAEIVPVVDKFYVEIVG